MKEVTVKRGPEGDLEVRHMPLALVYALRELPKLLSPEFPEATSRLSQDPYAGHPGEGAEDPSGDWSRHTRPELSHLFESARTLVLEDLEGLTREGDLPPLFEIRIPGNHLTAWLSALAAARIGLSEIHEVTAKDMEKAPGALLPNDRHRGILLIQLLGWMQTILIGDEEET
jgi:hypothetical protein